MHAMTHCCVPGLSCPLTVMFSPRREPGQSPFLLESHSSDKRVLAFEVKAGAQLGAFQQGDLPAEGFRWGINVALPMITCVGILASFHGPVDTLTLFARAQTKWPPQKHDQISMC